MRWFSQLSRPTKIALLVGGSLVLYLGFFAVVAVLGRSPGVSSPKVAFVPTVTPVPGTRDSHTPTALSATSSKETLAPTPTPEASVVIMPTTTWTPASSRIPTPASTVRLAFTQTPTATRSPTPTRTPTTTPTPTPTRTMTATHTPTLTRTPTRTTTPTTIPGLPTPTLAPEAFDAVAVASRLSDKTGLLVSMRLADGKPKRGSWIEVYRQKTDIGGNPIKGDRVAEGRTDDGGTIFFALPPDSYALQLGDYAGYLWGDEYNYQVVAGQATVVSITLGRLQIEVMNADGRGLSERWTEVYLQDTDIGGNPIRAERIGEARTANTGSVTYDLTPGMYAVEIGDIAGYSWGEKLNYPVLPGQTTTIRVRLGRVRVGIRNAEGRGLSDRWVGLYLQAEDLDGNPIRGDRVLEGRTDITGALTWDVTAGNYAISIGDISGDRWGEELNHEIKPGQTTTVLVTLGRLTVGLQDTQGRAIGGRWVGVYFQKKDLSLLSTVSDSCCRFQATQN